MTIRFVEAKQKTVPDYFIADRGRGAKLLVAVHGISRNAAEIAARFAADPRFGNYTICAPLFERHRFGQYQQLIARRGRVSADLALIDLLAVLARDVGCKSSKISLFGFSGGAQMAHRFAMLHPARVEQVFAASAGWYLMPDADTAYPYGLANDHRPDSAPDAFLKIPMTVAVGERDTQIDASVRQSKCIDDVQGPTRLARARSWVSAMQQCATDRGLMPQARLVMLPNGLHDFGQCVRDSGLIDAVANAFNCGHLGDIETI